VGKRSLDSALISAGDAWYWSEHSGIKLDGRTFSVKHHEYQVGPLRERAREQCARKGAQIGWTSIKMLKSVHGLIYGRYPQGVLYLFPTKGDVTDFSKGRFQPLIEDNPCIAQHVRNTDAANIKRIGNSMLYFRGAKSTRRLDGGKATASQLKSVPVDRIVFDEIDEMEPAMVDLAMERVSHSEIKEVDYIGTPTIPDYGIDLRWQRSSQRHWEIKCHGCGEYTCLEREFEQNGWQGQRVLIDVGGEIIRACRKCGREIYPRDGEWVAAYPKRDLVGWWVSQLNSVYVSPASVLGAFMDSRRNLAETYNSKIGMPYIEAQNRLTIQQVLACCGHHGIGEVDEGPCSMGVDQGKDLHVVIGKREGGKDGVIVHLGVYKDWEEMDGLMERYNVFRCVVDALPEMRNSRAFAMRFPGRVYLNYYNHNQKGAAAWNDARYTVQVNRTESLDASHDELYSGSVVLPRESDLVMLFAEQCHNVAKKLEEDDVTGSRHYVYVRLGADHFRHAFNYESMARRTGVTSVFA
jgi:hypothetical protein